MKTLIPLTIFLRSTKSPPSSPSPSLLLFFSTESHPRKRPLSSSSSSISETPQSFSTTSQTHDPSRNVRVSVWWDLENCGIPSGVSAFKIARNIVSAVRVSGIRGPVTITAFGDFIQVPRATQEALSCTGVLLNHVPNGQYCSRVCDEFNYYELSRHMHFRECGWEFERMNDSKVLRPKNKCWNTWN